MNYETGDEQGSGPPSFFDATDEVWDKFGNATRTEYISETDNDYSSPGTGCPITTDMTGGGFTPEESDYKASMTAATTSPGWDFMGGEGWPTFPVRYSVSRRVASSYSLQTGGKAATQSLSLFRLWVTAQNMTQLGTPSPTAVPVDYSNITVMGQCLSTDSSLSIVEPNGILIPIPVAVSGSQSFRFQVMATVTPINAYITFYYDPANATLFTQTAQDHVKNIATNISGALTRDNLTISFAPRLGTSDAIGLHKDKVGGLLSRPFQVLFGINVNQDNTSNEFGTYALGTCGSRNGDIFISKVGIDHNHDQAREPDNMWTWDQDYVVANTVAHESLAYTMAGLNDLSYGHSVPRFIEGSFTGPDLMNREGSIMPVTIKAIIGKLGIK